MKKGEREKENRRSGGEAGGEMGKGFLPIAEFYHRSDFIFLFVFE